MGGWERGAWEEHGAGQHSSARHWNMVRRSALWLELYRWQSRAFAAHTADWALCKSRWWSVDSGLSLKQLRTWLEIARRSAAPKKGRRLGLLAHREGSLEECTEAERLLQFRADDNS